jgi:hypothetical protein
VGCEKSVTGLVQFAAPTVNFSAKFPKKDLDVLTQPSPVFGIQFTRQSRQIAQPPQSGVAGSL